MTFKQLIYPVTFKQLIHVWKTGSLDENAAYVEMRIVRRVWKFHRIILLTPREGPLFRR